MTTFPSPLEQINNGETGAVVRAKLNNNVTRIEGHTHDTADVANLLEAIDDRVAALLVAGANITLTYNDAANTLTIAATSGGVTDGDKGDVVVSSSGATWTIDTGVVDAGKLASDAVTTIKIANGNVTFSKLAAAALATAAEFRNNTADRVLVTDDVWSAADEVVLTDAATIAVDLATGLNFTVTLGGNRTLGNPTNTKVGQSGVIRVLQDGTGGRTLAFGANWKFAGGTAFSIDTVANRESYLTYYVRSSTFIVVSGLAGVR